MSDEIKRTAISLSLLGETAVGKTCINNVFLGIEFLDEHLTTVGLEKMDALITIDTGETIKLKIWDTAGQERFRSVSINSLKSSQGAIVVFDLTNRQSFEKVEDWLSQIRNYSTKIVIGLFGNKCDLEEREVKQEEIDILCQKEDLIYFETSAKKNIGIKEGFIKIASLAYKAFEKEDNKKFKKLKKRNNKKSNKKFFC